MTALRVFLVVCVFVMVGASADASASSTAAATWTLTVTFAGTGTGLVTTVPAGILCTDENPYAPYGADQPLGTCSAQFSVDVAPWVIATPSGGSRGSLFGGMSNCEGEHGSCQAFQGQTDPTTEQVTFNLKPIPCIVRRVIGQPLAQAKRTLRFNLPGCKVGTVRYAYTSTNLNFGKVISQNPTKLWQRPSRRGQPRGQQRQTRVLGTAARSGVIPEHWPSRARRCPAHALRARPPLDSLARQDGPPARPALPPAHSLDLRFSRPLRTHSACLVRSPYSTANHGPNR